jgi:hypothetical protein
MCIRDQHKAIWSFGYDQLAGVQEHNELYGLAADLEELTNLFYHSPRDHTSTYGHLTPKDGSTQAILSIRIVVPLWQPASPWQCLLLI